MYKELDTTGCLAYLMDKHYIDAYRTKSYYAPDCRVKS
jgi:hypothetical protein